MEVLPGKEITKCWVAVVILDDATAPLLIQREGHIGIPTEALRLIALDHGIGGVVEAMAGISGVRERRRIQPSLN